MGRYLREFSSQGTKPHHFLTQALDASSSRFRSRSSLSPVQSTSPTMDSRSRDFTDQRTDVAGWEVSCFSLQGRTKAKRNEGATKSAAFAVEPLPRALTLTILIVLSTGGTDTTKSFILLTEIVVRLHFALRIPSLTRSGGGVAS